MTPDEFTDPYVDVDEWRDAPVRHRYVHGGFAGTETRFSIYLPPAEQYEGRFFQHITPVPDSEHLAQGATGEQDKIGFSIASGAYFLETNGGGDVGHAGVVGRPDHRGVPRQRGGARSTPGSSPPRCTASTAPTATPTAAAAAATARSAAPRTRTGVWDGVVPYVIGSPMAIPNMFTVRMHAQRVLRAPLRPDRRRRRARRQRRHVRRGSTTRSATRSSRSPGWGSRRARGSGTARMGMHAFPVLYGGVRMADPSYFDDFWTEPGYLGYAPPPVAAPRPRPVQHACEVGRAHRPTRRRRARPRGRPPAGAGARRRRHRLAGRRRAARRVPVAVRLSNAPGVDVLGADLSSRPAPPTGARHRPARRVARRHRRASAPADTDVIAQLAAGRHGRDRQHAASSPPRPTTATRCRAPDYPVWDQFRNPDGVADLPAAPAAARAAVRGGRSRDGPDRALRREDDRRRLAPRPRGARRGRPTGTARRCTSTSATRSTTTSASGSPTTPCTATTRSRRARPTRSATSACCTRRCATSALGRGGRRAAGEHELRGRRRAGRRARRRRRAAAGCSRWWR